MPQPAEQPSLAALLLQRMSGTEKPMPSDIGPIASTPGSAPSTFSGNPLGYLFEHGVDMGKGFLTGDAPPGMNARGAGALLSAAAPFVRIGGAKKYLGALSHLPEEAEQGYQLALSKAVKDAEQWGPFSSGFDGEHILGAAGGVPLNYADHKPGNPSFVQGLNRLGTNDLINTEALEGSFKEMPPSAAKKAADMANYLKKLSGDLPHNPQWYANQATLPPMGHPLISHHPNVSQEKAADIANYLKKLSDDYAHEGGPDVYEKIKQLAVTEGGGGSFNRSTHNVVIGVPKPEEELVQGREYDTVAHEFRHALDQRNNPEVFKDYPASFFAGLLPPKPEYWTHPSEVRARATGKLEHFLKTSHESGQGTLQPKEFLQGVADADSDFHGRNQSVIQKLLADQKPAPRYEYQSEPQPRYLPNSLILQPGHKY